ncbi:ABC transporter permease [Thermocrispum agreste]|uniref:ABC transporter permease n=1 Tax=Thermocrispum agreste TaxID=37925 RepID=A0A2W4JTW2_9PSEU|nr:ABC transporter permease [Thermocrispum agreste]PZM97217.1 MAG: ABC transporter permease [Thermocrispum agreste]
MTTTTEIAEQAGTDAPGPAAVSGWTATRLVAEREIRTYVRMKGFWIGLVLVLIGIFAAAILPGVIGGGPTSIAVVGQAADALQEQAGFEVRTVADADAARELVRNEEVEAAVVPDAQGNPAGVRIIALSEPPMDVIAALTTAPPVDLLEQGDVSAGQRQLVIMVFALVFLMFGMGGLAIAQSTVTEKQTRIVEILVAAVPVRSLLAGKLLGHTVLALGQVVLFAAAAPIALRLGELDGLLTAITPALGWFVPFLVAGFVLLGSLWAIAGALVSRQEDLGSTTGSVTMLVMLPYFLVMFFSDDPLVMTVLSYVPFSASVAMPVRLFTGEAAAWEALLALAVVAATAAAVLLLASRIYAGSLLQTRGRVGLAQAWAGRN